jgi:hypothetical protein
MRKKKRREFLLYYLIRYPWGIARPKVVRGYFAPGPFEKSQQLFFDALLKRGFRRTKLQVILPGQTAGLVKRIPPHKNGADECHVRFYDDGTIECEIEHRRGHIYHLSAVRWRSTEFLESLLNEHKNEFHPEVIPEIRKLFGEKERVL